MPKPDSDLGEDLATARSQLAEFEDMIYTAISTSLRRLFPPDWAETMIRDHHMFKWSLLEFFDLYQRTEVYPLFRLPNLAYRIMDLKLQLYNSAQVMPTMHNHLFSDTEFTIKDPHRSPGLYLQHLCVMQAWIGASRILWDRLMSFVYYLEEGHEPNGRSIRRAFFARIGRWDQRWQVFAEWEDRIDEYDRLYRTPEFHKNSTLRASLFKDDAIDPNKIMSPLTPVMNGFWQVLMANIEGRQSHVVGLGRTIDPEFDDFEH